MGLKVLNSNNHEDLEYLILCIEETLSNALFWLPISMRSREHFFDEEWTYFLGIYEGGKLIAAGALFFNENEYGESRQLIKCRAGNVAEIGRLMVLPEYRNRGYIKTITAALVEYAEKVGIDILIATAHPENIPSRKVLESVGMIKQGSCIKAGKYERDIFVLEL